MQAYMQYQRFAVFVIVVLLHATAPAIEPAAAPALKRARLSECKLSGYVGAQIDLAVTNWLLRAPDANPAMLQMFADRDKEPFRNLLPWSGEFAGKYLTGATQVYRVTHDPRLKQRIESFVADLVKLQDADGYLGPFPHDYRLTGKAPNVDGGATWDAWGHYHAMIGLLAWHDETADAAALSCARRIGDLLCERFLPADKSVVATGSAEMNQAVAHGMALLYRQTADSRHVQLAEKVVAEFAAPGAGDYLRAGLAGSEFFQTPKPRWESLHPIMALAELYWITGKPEYRQAYENLWWSIVKLDRHNNGGFSSGEQAQGNPYHRGAIETCCTIAWMAMSVEMLRMTGDPRVADELELSTLNQVVGLHAPRGDWCTYNTPMDGQRIPSTEDIAFQIRPGSEQLNCCSVNAARGFGLLSDWALMTDGNGVVLNWYGSSSLLTSIKETPVKLTQETEYPVGGRISLRIEPARALSFPLRLRIPHWSIATRVTVNGEPATATPGTYLAIDRTWQPGDRVAIELDMSLRYWRGEREYEGKSSIYRGPLLLAYELDQKAPRFSRHWKTFDQTHSTRDAGATVEQDFDGDEIAWRGSLFDDAGKARVSIDGQQIAVVDQFGPKPGEPFAWEKKGLGAGKHTIRIETLGEKTAASKDAWINVSGFTTPASKPTFDAAKLRGDVIRVSASEDFSITLPDANGVQIQLRDFGRSGRDRKPYITWLDVRGTKSAPFSRDNPSRTAQ